MTNFSKKLLPIILALLIIASLVWYCFVYDRDFTRDMLLSQARTQSTSGNAKIASWWSVVGNPYGFLILYGIKEVPMSDLGKIPSLKDVIMILSKSKQRDSSIPII